MRERPESHSEGRNDRGEQDAGAGVGQERKPEHCSLGRGAATTGGARSTRLCRPSIGKAGREEGIGERFEGVASPECQHDAQDRPGQPGQEYARPPLRRPAAGGGGEVGDAESSCVRSLVEVQTSLRSPDREEERQADHRDDGGADVDDPWIDEIGDQELRHGERDAAARGWPARPAACRASRRRPRPARTER